MKKKTSILIALLLGVVIGASVGLVACDNGNAAPQAPSEYVIQYTDDDGVHQITVKSGDVYSIESIPTKTGYDFIGLYDAKVGGTQYVDEDGVSLSPFADNKNLILFPQFKAKAYKVILNYGDAPVTGVREISVEYDSELPELPVNLTAENKDFKGWYTEPNCRGTQIADTFGVLPDRRLITEQNFDLTNANGYIYLYAGFRGTMRTVTFYGESGSAPIEMQIEHGTSIGNIVPDYRTEEGFGVLEWTQDSNPTESSLVFKGEIVDNMTLYAKTYAPVIDFDPNGGEEVSSIVASAGSAIALPEATRENWQFAGWYTTGGVRYTATTMPQESIALTARWTPKLIFDERGGTLVDDIAAEQGTKVTLPTTEKDGYMFAGWYTEQGEEYTSTAMPSVSTKLVAKYRKVLTKKVVIFSNTETRRNDLSAPSIDEGCDAVDLTDIFNSGVRLVKITAHYQVMYENSSGYKTISSTQPAYTHMKWYSAYSASDAYCVWSYSDEHVANRTWSSITQTAEIDLNSGTLYVCRYLSIFYNRNSSDASWTDFWIEIEYPDMSQLY